MKIASMKAKGFTLIETILLVSVISVMMVLAFPNIIATFKFQKTFDEKLKMDMIREGLEKYVDTYMKLPDEGSDWAKDISPYTPMSINDIKLDSWNHPRVYRKGILPQDIAGNDYDIGYAIVLSYGEDGCLGVAASCNPSVPNPALAETTFDTDPADFKFEMYENIEADASDFLIKFTTYPQQVEAFHETNRRIQRLTKALSDFSTEVYSEAMTVAIDSGAPDFDGQPSLRDWNFYPPSGATGDSVSDYHPLIKNGTTVALLGNSLDGGSTSDSSRYTYMIRLMRMLGLPDDHCCNAMERFTFNGVSVEKPFYYYSNPKPRNGSICGSRPGLGNLKQPARISVDSDSCG